jgi:hypothetical protein
MASIFGVLIGVAILMTVILPSQIYIRQVETFYERQVKEAKEEDIIRSKEDLDVIAYPINENSTFIRLDVENKGEASSSLILLWIKNECVELDVDISVGETVTLGPYNVSVETNSSYHIKTITSRGNTFSSLTGTLFFGDGTWYTPSLGISVYIANDKGKYHILVYNTTWSDEYYTQGLDFGDLIWYSEVNTGGLYTVVCQKQSGGWTNLPGTPINVEIQWPEGTPIIYVYTSGLEI